MAMRCWLSAVSSRPLSRISKLPRSRAGTSWSHWFWTILALTPNQKSYLNRGRARSRPTNHASRAASQLQCKTAFAAGALRAVTRSPATLSVGADGLRLAAGGLAVRHGRSSAGDVSVRDYEIRHG